MIERTEEGEEKGEGGKWRKEGLNDEGGREVRRASRLIGRCGGLGINVFRHRYDG